MENKIDFLLNEDVDEVFICIMNIVIKKLFFSYMINDCSLEVRQILRHKYMHNHSWEKVNELMNYETSGIAYKKTLSYLEEILKKYPL